MDFSFIRKTKTNQICSPCHDRHVSQYGRSINIQLSTKSHCNLLTRSLFLLVAYSVHSASLHLYISCLGSLLSPRYPAGDCGWTARDSMTNYAFVLVQFALWRIAETCSSIGSVCILILPCIYYTT